MPRSLGDGDFSGQLSVHKGGVKEVATRMHGKQVVGAVFGKGFAYKKLKGFFVCPFFAGVVLIGPLTMMAGSADGDSAGRHGILSMTEKIHNMHDAKISFEHHGVQSVGFGKRGLGTCVVSLQQPRCRDVHNDMGLLCGWDKAMLGWACLRPNCRARCPHTGPSCGCKSHWRAKVPPRCTIIELICGPCWREPARVRRKLGPSWLVFCLTYAKVGTVCPHSARRPLLSSLSYSMGVDITCREAT